MKTGKSKEIVSRAGDLDKVMRFLENPGGTLLLGGDRGSGKTTLVNQAVKRRRDELHNDQANRLMKWTAFARRLTYSKMIYINIPLIVISETVNSDGTNPQPNTRGLSEQYRSLLMRAMVMGLLSNQYSRKAFWLDLPRRWFHSIGYNSKLRSLKPYIAFTKVSKTSTLSLAASIATQASTNVSQAIQSDLDLSDSALEINFRNLLTEHSRQHQFIFVFDELDKLPASISLAEIVLYMKNLFTETNVYGIFITDEKSLAQLQTDAKSVPPSHVTTLFAEHILINNLGSDEFRTLLKKVISDIDTERFDELQAVLAVRTLRSPHALNQILLRFGTSFKSITDGLLNEMGSQQYNRVGAMQHYVEFTYDIFADDRDTHFNRVLEHCLVRAGQILLNEDTSSISFKYPETLFYTSNMFRSEDSSKDDDMAKEINAKNGRVPALSRPAILQEFDSLPNADQRRRVQDATECLLVVLNRTGNLDLSLADVGDAIKIGSISNTGFKHDIIKPASFMESINLSRKEINLVNDLNLYRAGYYKLCGRYIYGDFRYVNLEKINVAVREYGKYSIANIAPLWTRWDETVATVQKDLVSELVSKLEVIKAGTYEDVEYRDNSATVTLSSGHKLQIQLLYRKQKIVRSSDADKLVIILDPSAKKQASDYNDKNFELSLNWGNFNSLLKYLNDWCEKH